MADNQQVQKPPWPVHLAEQMTNKTEYLRHVRDSRSARRMFDTNGRTKVEFKFKEAADEALFVEQIRMRALELDEALKKADDRLQTAPELSEAIGMLDLYRGRSLADVHKTFVEKVVSALEKRPAYIPDVLSRLGNVPGISIEDLQDVRQAIRTVETKTQSFEKKWQQLRDERATTDTELEVLCAKLSRRDEAVARYRKTISKVLKCDHPLVNVDVIAMIVEDDSPHAGLRKQLESEFRDNSELQKELSTVKNDLTMAQSAAQLPAANNAESLQAIIDELRKNLKDCQDQAKDLEDKISLKDTVIGQLQERQQDDSDEISQLRRTNQSYLEDVPQLKEKYQKSLDRISELEKTDQDHLGQVSRLQEIHQKASDEVDQLEETIRQYSLKVDQLEETIQEQSEDIGQLNSALEHSEAATSAEKLRIDKVTASLEIERGNVLARTEAENAALSRISKLDEKVTVLETQLQTVINSESSAQEQVKRLYVDLDEANEACRKLQSSIIEDQRAASEARTRVTELDAEMGNLRTDLKEAANDQAVIKALRAEVEDLKSKAQTTSDENQRLKTELATFSETATQAESENEQLRHVCMVLLRKINIDLDDCIGLHANFSHASRLAIQLQGTYPVRKSISMLSTIHDMITETTDRSFSAWDIALLVLTKQQVVSVAMIDAFAVELGRVNDNQYWLVLAILLSFVRKCLMKGKLMPFCTSMVVLRAIEVLVSVGLTAELAVLEETKDMLNAGCLVQAFFRCIKAQMQGQHPVLVSELPPNSSQVIKIKTGWLAPDEDNLSLLFSDDVNVVLIRRHQFQLRFGQKGIELVFEESIVTETIPSAILPEDPAVVLTFQDALSRIGTGAVEPDDASLEMRIDGTFLM